jgi:1,4-alpha-glucan branching enzyme
MTPARNFQQTPLMKRKKTRRMKHMKTQYLTLQRSGANSVFIAGSFNDWAPDATPLLKIDNDSWAVELALPPGRYEYRFVVDGEWIDDAKATESAPNPFGSVNAVFIVAD